MSWQSYVDDQLVATGAVTQAAIAGLDGSIWAKSNGFGITQDEAKQIASGFGSFGGVTVAGTRYVTINSDDKFIYGKKGATGCVCVKTKKACIIAVYNETIQPGRCAMIVEKVGDFLIEKGY
eukprot:GEZU01003763.1.p2 GENE.GEZU01003763.1~~GEZU01003763.1.p2  ORF type:complete len:122 (-),score=38.25 GEZU01003763.1:155-520(-)